MITVIVNDNEQVESALRRLKRLVEKSGLIKELRLRERFEKFSKKKQRKMVAAKKREIKRQKLLCFQNKINV